MVSGSESAIQVHLVLLMIVAIPAISSFFFFYGKAYDMIVSYTIRQEQDRSAETAPLIEESIQKIVDVSDSISSLDFYQTLFKNNYKRNFFQNWQIPRMQLHFPPKSGN